MSLAFLECPTIGQCVKEGNLHVRINALFFSCPLTEETKRQDIYNLTADPSAKEREHGGRRYVEIIRRG